MAIKEKDMVILNYTGRTKDEGQIFDTTDLKTAQENGLMNERTTEETFEAATVCVGMGEILKGIDKSLVGKDKGQYTTEIGSEDAFGVKTSKLVQLIPMSKFRKEKMRPFPGMEVMVDDGYGIVRTVSGGRVIVDFNHPFASKDVIYDVDVLEVITDDLEKIKKLTSRPNLKPSVDSVEMKGKEIVVTFNRPLVEQEMEMMVKIFSNYITDKDTKISIQSNAKEEPKKE